MAELAIISNMVAELQDPRSLGAMMLQQLVTTGAFYILSVCLLLTAYSLIKEVAAVEKKIVVVEEHEDAQPLFIAPMSGTRAHVRRECSDLHQAGTVRQIFFCRVCCSEGLLRCERTHHVSGRKFSEVRSKYLWLKVCLAAVLLSVAASLLLEGKKLQEGRYNQFSALHAEKLNARRAVSADERREGHKEQSMVDSEHVELFQEWFYKIEPNAVKKNHKVNLSKNEDYMFKAFPFLISTLQVMFNGFLEQFFVKFEMMAKSWIPCRSRKEPWACEADTWLRCARVSPTFSFFAHHLAWLLGS